MKNRKLILSAVIALIAVTFNACIEDPEPAPLDSIADVFTQKTIVNGEVKYGLSFWTLSNKALESVSVEGPDEETWQLNGDEGNQTVFRLFPETNQYSDSVPTAGDYKFTVTSTQEDEASITLTDKLENNELDTVSIDSAKFVNSRLTLTWPVVQNADNYLVRLYDDSDNLLYVSPSVAGNKTNFTFGNNDAGWASTTSRATTGENYRVELLALLYESTSTSVNQDYNIQFISHTSKDIVWGE